MGHLKDHVVICNWNRQGIKVVRALRPMLFSQQEKDWHVISVVAPDVTHFPADDCFEDTMLVPGSPLDSHLLLRANVQDAHTVIILADRNVSNPDDKTLMIALAIRSLLRRPDIQRHRSKGKDPRIVAEVIDAGRTAALRQTDVTGIHEVICGPDLSINAIARANVSHGLTTVLHDLLEYREKQNDIYMVDIPERWTDSWKAGGSFGDLVQAVGEWSSVNEGGRRILLIGHNRVLENGRCRMLINASDAQLKEWGPFEPGDQFVVLAEDREHLAHLTGGGVKTFAASL